MYHCKKGFKNTYRNTAVWGFIESIYFFQFLSWTWQVIVCDFVKMRSPKKKSILTFLLLCFFFHFNFLQYKGLNDKEVTLNPVALNEDRADKLPTEKKTQSLQDKFQKVAMRFKKRTNLLHERCKQLNFEADRFVYGRMLYSRKYETFACIVAKVRLDSISLFSIQFYSGLRMELRL